MPLGPGNSVPGTLAHPPAGLHCQTSPVTSPLLNIARKPAPSGPRQPPSLREVKLVIANPLSGNTATPLPLTPSGASAQPTQAIVGILARASISKTSTDSRP